MAVPMPKKRTWSTRETDAESEETAAFEATVAAAQDTAAKSGAFLSTAKSDLTDHKRWLQAQSVAVERDRARHERWLQRQREHRLAAARKDRARRRRQLMRQRAVRAMQAATIASFLFLRSLILLAVARAVSGLKYLGSLIARAAAYLGHLIAAAAAMMAAGLKYLGWLIARGAAYLGHLIAAAAAMMAAGLKYLGWLITRGAAYVGRLIAAGVHWTAAKLHIFAYLVGRNVATGSSAAAAKAGVLSRSAGRSIGSGFSVASGKGSTFADAAGRSASRGLARFGDRASIVGAAGKRQLAAGYRWSSKRVAALAPALYVRVARLGRQAERYARRNAARTEGMFARAKVTAPPSPAQALAPVAVVYGPHRDGIEIDGRPANDSWVAPAVHVVESFPPAAHAAEPEVYGPFYEGFWVAGVSPNEPRRPGPQPVPALQSESAAPRAEMENALSSWARDAWYRTRSIAAQTEDWARSRSWSPTKEADLSQMMIIAGAVLLVCGGLLLGGGLFLRAGAGTTATEAREETATGITWMFQEADLPLPERAVFTLSGTPQSFRINGLSVGGVNQSDQPLTGVEAVLKPDAHRPDLKLTLQVDKPAVAAGEDGTPAQALEVAPKDTVPPNTPFRLVFAFPPGAMEGADGLAVEDFFESYGGLLLKIRYELDGKQRSLIQYLPPEMLKGQLDEVAAEAGGS